MAPGESSGPKKIDMNLEERQISIQIYSFMATHSSPLAWRIPWREEPGRLQSIGLQSRTRLSEKLLLNYYHKLGEQCMSITLVCQVGSEPLGLT